jgi:hypothetical protein
MCFNGQMFLLNIITKLFLRPELSRKDAIIIQHIVLIATLKTKGRFKNELRGDMDKGEGHCHEIVLHIVDLIILFRRCSGASKW